MIFIINIYIIFLNIIYLVFKLNKTKKKVLFLSRQSNKASLDFEMMISEIKNKYPEYEVVVITKRIEKNFWEFAIQNQLLMFKTMYHLSTSEVTIIDGYNLYISTLKHKKELKIVQIWHALGAVKKFGKALIYNKQDKKIAEALKQHENYDYIIASSSKTVDYYAENFGCSKDKIINLGMPRIDYILSSEKKNKKSILKKYPEFKNKKIVLYAPTFRDNNNYKINELVDKFDKDYILILKLHPNIKIKTNYDHKNIYFCPEFNTLQLLSVAEHVITDYSSLSIEASILNKKLYFYVYDYDEYANNPGLNINLYKYFKGYMFKKPLNIYKKIKENNYDINLVKKYRNDYVNNTNGNVTEKLVEFILEEK